MRERQQQLAVAVAQLNSQRQYMQSFNDPISRSIHYLMNSTCCNRAFSYGYTHFVKLSVTGYLCLSFFIFSLCSVLMLFSYIAFRGRVNCFADDTRPEIIIVLLVVGLEFFPATSDEEIFLANTGC